MKNSSPSPSHDSVTTVFSRTTPRALAPVADVTRAELLSRVGRVGLAAAMAVPLVTSIVAPTAAKAYGLESHNDDNDDNRGDKKSDKKPDDWILRFLRIED